MEQIDISYIVSLYNRTDQLRVCLAMLAAQTHQDFEIIITDNTTDPATAKANRELVTTMGGRYFATSHLKVSDCYWSSEFGMTKATGRWLGFPCEDVYYPPQWAQRMLGAAVTNNWDLVLCSDVICGPDTCGAPFYMPLELGSASFPGYKSSFLAKRARFTGWINKPKMTACSGVDKTTLQYMVRDKEIRSGICRGLYYIHN